MNHARSCRQQEPISGTLQVAAEAGFAPKPGTQPDGLVAVIALVPESVIELITDFVMISNCGKCRFFLYAPKPFSFQDLHEHPLGASRLSFLLSLLRSLDARKTPSLSTSEYL